MYKEFSPMKAFWTLYWNELKSNKIILLFLIIAAYGIYYQSIFVGVYTFRPEWLLKRFSQSALFLIPLALYYLFKEGRNSNQNYLMFSMPFRRDLYILSQFLVILSYIILIPIGSYIILGIILKIKYLLLYHYTWSFKQMVIYTIQSTLLNLHRTFQSTTGIILIYKISIPFIVLLGGMMSLLVSFNSIIKRYRVAAGIIFLNSLILFFIVSGLIVRHIFILYYGDNYLWNYSLEFNLLVWLLIQGYMFAVGLLFLLIGMHLYEKYADV